MGKRSGPMTTVEAVLRGPVGWPLRRVGLDPGRARANARPEVARLRADRVEQFAYIAGKLASAGEPLVMIAHAASCARPEDVSITVFDGDRLVTGHAALAAPLRESIKRATRATVSR